MEVEINLKNFNECKSKNFKKMKVDFKNFLLIRRASERVKRRTKSV